MTGIGFELIRYQRGTKGHMVISIGQVSNREAKGRFESGQQGRLRVGHLDTSVAFSPPEQWRLTIEGPRAF